MIRERKLHERNLWLVREIDVMKKVYEQATIGDRAMLGLRILMLREEIKQNVAELESLDTDEVQL